MDIPNSFIKLPIHLEEDQLKRCLIISIFNSISFDRYSPDSRMDKAFEIYEMMERKLK